MKEDSDDEQEDVDCMVLFCDKAIYAFEKAVETFTDYKTLYSHKFFSIPVTVSKTALALCYKIRDEISKENPNYGEIDRLSQSLQQEMEGAVVDDEEDIVLDSDVKESGPPEDDEVVD
ncbi:hypothetical protein B9Z55_015491 [Caenorhabditis nigoni]|uniref:Uncharacterized protein n=1 Tax=Caenorhabditis nigoni TaxID=1611254 RepID=A0A2G5UAJ0_9PELO|nr:hypothetical protein B9Z55_015491 [Caenorhabditis nigoni]